MSKLLRRLFPVAAALAWRNRDRITDWYQQRKEPDQPKADPTPESSPEATDLQ